MCSNIKEYVKILFYDLDSIVLCKHCVAGNVKDDVTKYGKFSNFSY